MRGLNDKDAREIIEELRGHILDRAAASGDVTAASVDAALAALGTPEDLARQYTLDGLLARAEAGRSPVRILESLFGWASLSVAGFGVLLSAMSGYVVGLGLILCAVLKPFHPHTAGLWMLRAHDLSLSLRLGFESAPPGAREVLGWWIMPLGIVVGCGLVTLTTYFALWCVGRYSSSRSFAQGKSGGKPGSKPEERSA